MRYLILTVLFTMGCSHLVKVPEENSKPISDAEALTAYTRVLHDFVNDKGQVNFPKLAANPLDLEAYVRYVAQTPIGHFTGSDDLMAHYLNAYNALSMYNVIRRGIPESNSGLKKIWFFYLSDFVIGGTEMSLYAFETKVIRKRGDERVHFALNCMSVSCPKLPQEPFKGSDLNAELDQAARFFFSEPRNLTVDDQKHQVFVSEILKFYTADFLKKAPSLIEYINRWREKPIPTDDKVEFYDYDWRINNSAKL